MSWSLVELKRLEPLTLSLQTSGWQVYAGHLGMSEG